MNFSGNNTNSTVFAPGWFLAAAECERETKQIAQSGAEILDNGGKVVRMGTIYPSNDSSAIGIVYEDIDVTSGNMPGSVVTKGTVYEDRLAFSGYAYTSVTLKNLVSPKEQGWQERSGEGTDLSPYVYATSTDTTVNTSKTYYLNDTNHTVVSDYAAVLNPRAEGWYESDGQNPATYTLSTDTVGDKTKTYYTQSVTRMSDNAKTALEALGFKFIANAPAVTRPY